MDDRFRELERLVADLQESKENDSERVAEARRLLQSLLLRELFTGPYDNRAAVISIYPGAGGEDAEDWAGMLAAMYRKYAEMRGWKVKVIDPQPNRRTFEIAGKYAYGYLKYESGVHRLVRISPFSAKKLRHTSFALVEVLPDLPEVDEQKFSIPDEDLKFEFSRSGGPGGQNVNKVETAVRVVHIPTGISASSQVERSQAANRERALRLLKAKLYHQLLQRRVATLDELKVKAKPEWGSQIRSYVLHPYKLVKDHRTGVETSNAEEVLEGALDVFIESEIELLGGGQGKTSASRL